METSDHVLHFTSDLASFADNANVTIYIKGKSVFLKKNLDFHISILLVGATNHLKWDGDDLFCHQSRPSCSRINLDIDIELSNILHHYRSNE